MARRTLKDSQVLYNQVLGNEAGKQLLADLRVFCYGTKSTFDSCPYETARREGRREVFLQIMNTLKVDFSDYYDYEPDFIDEEM